MRYRITVCFLLLFTRLNAQTPAIEMLHVGNKISLRGLSVPNDNVIWVSGNKGTVGRSTNGGKTWKWITVKGFEKADFRDIEAFDAMAAVIMAVGADDPAYILKTIDGGESWKVVYENKTRGIFLDAMEFWNERSGIVIGDPMEGRFFVTRTFDGGDNWQDIPMEKRPLADSGEACFAASGTNIRALDKDEAAFVSGGRRSRLFIRDQRIDLPLIQGKETTGANSIAIGDRYTHKAAKKMIVVGGDFNADSSIEKNCFYSRDGGKTWLAPATPPHGYRSCVEFLVNEHAFACGLTGVDHSTDGGKNWTLISTDSYHVCRASKLGKAVYFAGANGRIGRLTWK